MINAYLLALAAGFAFGGRLADVLGSKTMVLVGIVGFATTSLLCGLTPNGRLAEAWIIMFRALQGLSAALMIPAALAVVVAAFPIGERGRALAVFFGVSGGLTAIGPIAGGFLTQWTWRAIFWINVPIAVLAVVLTVMAGINTRRPQGADRLARRGPDQHRHGGQRARLRAGQRHGAGIPSGPGRASSAGCWSSRSSCWSNAAPRCR